MAWCKHITSSISNGLWKQNLSYWWRTLNQVSVLLFAHLLRCFSRSKTASWRRSKNVTRHYVLEEKAWHDFRLFAGVDDMLMLKYWDGFIWNECESARAGVRDEECSNECWIAEWEKWCARNREHLIDEKINLNTERKGMMLAQRQEQTE